MAWDTGSMRHVFDIGRDCARASGQMIRNMAKQSSDGFSIDTFTKYNSALDVHATSGIFNKVLCTLRHYNVAHQQAFVCISRGQDGGIYAAFDLMLVANLNKWTSSTGFIEAAELVFQAADELRRGQHYKGIDHSGLTGEVSVAAVKYTWRTRYRSRTKLHAHFL